MNRKVFFPIVLIVFVLTSIAAKAGDGKGNIPLNINAILEKSCVGCHNTDSKNDKAKEKLDLKTFDQLDKPGMLHALKEINKTLEENEMPPEKFLAKFPEKKLTDDEKKILMDWTKSETKSLKKK